MAILRVKEQREKKEEKRRKKRERRDSSPSPFASQKQVHV